MKKGLVFAVLLLAATPAVAQKIHIDWDREVDIDAYKTFAWAETREVSIHDTNPLMHSRIKNAIEYQLTKGGMVENNENPDVYVTYFTEEKEEVRVHTSNWGYGYGAGWYVDPYWGGGIGTSSTHVFTYPVGTLVIDFWDAKAKKVVWRGTAEATIPEKPEKQTKLIDRAVQKMADQWEKMRRRGKR